jgi:hypothetical protein
MVTERTESEERARYRVWYATREKLEHPLASLTIFTDRGNLELEPEGLWFQGQTLEFAVQNVLTVSLIKTHPWRGYGLIIALIVAAPFIMVSGILEIVFFNSTRDSFGLMSGLVSCIPGVLLWGVPLVILLLYKMKWVFVKYYDGERMRSAYFADSSLVGLGRRSARTEQIYEALRPYSRQS